MEDKLPSETEVLENLHKEFRVITEEYQYAEINPTKVVARFVFFASMMNALGISDTFDYWLDIAKKCDVKLLTKEESKKYIN